MTASNGCNTRRGMMALRLIMRYLIISGVFWMLSAHALAMSFIPVPELSARPTTASVKARPVPLGKADRLVVKKAERRLYLLRGEQRLRTYGIALGFQPIGHKLREGDGRTPEGRYVIDRRNDRSRFHKALHISYPSAQDRLRAEHRDQSPGGLILIHGQPANQARSAPLEGDWTLGCIAVANDEIEEIWALTPDGTRIEILP